MLSSIESITTSTQAMQSVFADSKEVSLFGAHMKNLEIEYEKFVKAKLVFLCIGFQCVGYRNDGLHDECADGEAELLEGPKTAD